MHSLWLLCGYLPKTSDSLCIDWIRAGAIHAAHPAVDGQLPDVSIAQPVPIPSGPWAQFSPDPLGFRLCQDLQQLLLNSGRVLGRVAFAGHHIPNPHLVRILSDKAAFLAPEQLAILSPEI